MKAKLFSILLFLAPFLALSTLAVANTWYVNGVGGSNGNNCTSPTTACKTIRHAVSLAKSGDSIIVAAATYTENLKIGISLTIVGSGAPTTIVDGGHAAPVVTISSGSANVTLSKLTIRNGFSAHGGGVYSLGTLSLIASIITGNGAVIDGGGIDSRGGTLIIKDSTISGNRAHTGGGIFGGMLTINSSTISGNSANALCIFGHCLCGTGGGITSGALTVNNSTISGNSGNCRGGGIASYSGMATINSTTISGNSAIAGGGIFNESGTTILQNSIVANSSSGGNCSGTLTSNGYNLSSDNTCNFTGPGDMNNINPNLGPLQNNGGPTQTMALPSGSPAVDAGNPSGCTDGSGHLLKTDQRGQPRPDPEDTGGCDMGGYERQSD